MVHLWRRVVLACFFSVLVFAVIPSFAAEPATVGETPAKEKELVDRIVEAHGGRDALAKVKSIFMRSYYNMYNQDNDGWVSRYLQRPDKLRVETRFQMALETRIMNGKKGWTGVGTAALKEADRYAYEGLVFQYNYMYLPFSLVDGGNALIYQGKDKVGNVAVDVLLIKDMNGLDVTLYADEKTHLISRVSSPIRTGSTTIDVSVEFLDYRDVNSIKFPFKVLSGHGKDTIGATTVSQVVINQAMEDKLFDPGEIPPKK
jgi:hypothetical protein